MSVDTGKIFWETITSIQDLKKKYLPKLRVGENFLNLNKGHIKLTWHLMVKDLMLSL